LATEHFVYGFHPVEEAIRSGKEIDRLLVQKGITHGKMSELINLAREAGIPFQFVPQEKLDRLIRGRHQGFVCFISPVTYQKIEDVVPGVFEQGRVPLLVVLDRITDVRNLGAIARSAECAGADALLLPVRESAQVNDIAVKTSAGALNRIPVCRTGHLPGSLKHLKDSGLQIVCATEKAGQDHYRCDLTLPTALVLGSEEAGISENILGMSDHLVRIPMKGSIASLNVSVAAGILLFEAVRQRSASPG